MPRGHADKLRNFFYPIDGFVYMCITYYDEDIYTQPVWIPAYPILSAHLIPPVSSSVADVSQYLSQKQSQSQSQRLTSSLNLSPASQRSADLNLSSSQPVLRGRARTGQPNPGAVERARQANVQAMYNADPPIDISSAAWRDDPALSERD
jgi:hypothetical protein